MNVAVLMMLIKKCFIGCVVYEKTIRGSHISDDNRQRDYSAPKTFLHRNYLPNGDFYTLILENTSPGGGVRIVFQHFAIHPKSTLLVRAVCLLWCFILALFYTGTDM